MKKFLSARVLSILALILTLYLTLQIQHISTVQKTFASATSTIGYLDLWNSTTHNWCAQITGWACDTTDPSKPIQVDLYAPNPYSSGVHSIAQTTANLTSGDEAAIAGFCGAATGNKKSYPHRFAFNLPASLENGTQIGVYAYGHALDGTHTALLGHSAKITCTTSKPTGPSGYTYCSMEGSSCTLTGTMDVAFGANGQYKYLTNKTGTIQCNITTFGGDPAPHITKACFVKTSSDTSPEPTHHTYLNIALQLPGIGAGGNLSPHHTSRTLHLSIYAADVDPTQPNVKPIFDTKTATVTFNSTTGYFTNASIDAGTLPTGDYQLLVKVPGYLRKAYEDTTNSTFTIHITAGTTTLVPSIKLIAGDVSPLYNVMDVSDFYAIVGCYKDKATSSTCSIGSQLADMNDDGVVDGIDLNYWLLGFQTLQANNNSNGIGDGVTGD